MTAKSQSIEYYHRADRIKHENRDRPLESLLIFAVAKLSWNVSRVEAL